MYNYFRNLFFVVEKNKYDEIYKNIYIDKDDAIRILKNKTVVMKNNNKKLHKTYSYCLIFSYDTFEKEYKYNKEQTINFFKSLPICNNCETLIETLEKKICEMCENNSKDFSTFKCHICKNIKRKFDNNGDDIFATLENKKGEDYIICLDCIKQTYNLE